MVLTLTAGAASPASAVGAADGALAAFTAAGATGGIVSHVWTATAGGSIIYAADANAKTNLLPGSYTLTVKDGSNATASATATVLCPILIKATIVNATTTGNFVGNNGSITTTVTGGAAGTATYSWTCNGTPIVFDTPRLAGCIAGVYTVTVTIAGGTGDAYVKTRPFTVLGTVPPEGWSIETVTANRTTASAYRGTQALSATMTRSPATYPYLFMHDMSFQDSFTLEFFYYQTVLLGGAFVFYGTSNNITPGRELILFNSTTKLYVSQGTGDPGTIASIAISTTLNVWRHVAVSYDAVANRFYTAYDGTVVAAAANAVPRPTIVGAKRWAIMCRDDTKSEYTVGYVDSVRVSKACLYTANYTVPDPVAAGWKVNPTTIFYDDFEDKLTVTPGAISMPTTLSGTDGAIGAPAVSGGTAPYAYSWLGPGRVSLAATTSSLSGIGAGRYILRVQSSNGLYKVHDYFVYQPLAPSAAVTNCTQRDPNGSIDLSVPGAIASPTVPSYSWTLGGTEVSTARSPFGLVPGTYTVTVTQGAAAGTATATVYGIVPGAVTDTSAYGTATGGIAATGVATAPGAVTYAWTSSPGATAVTGTGLSGFTDLSAGTYTLTVSSNGSPYYRFVFCVRDKFELVSITPIAATNGINGSVDVVTRGGDVSPACTWRFTGFSPVVDTAAKPTTLIPGSYYCVLISGAQSLTTPSVTVTGDFGAPVWSGTGPVITSADSYTGSKCSDHRTLTQNLTGYPRLSVPGLSYQQDWTVEGFIKPAGTTTNNRICIGNSSTIGVSNTNTLVTVNTATTLYGAVSTTTATVIVPTITSAAWNHFALCFDANLNTVYVCVRGTITVLALGAIALPFTALNAIICPLWRSDNNGSSYDVGFVDAVRCTQANLYGHAVRRSYAVPDATVWYAGGVVRFLGSFEDLIIAPAGVTAAATATSADGAVTGLIVTGGTAPYSYAWISSTGAAAGSAAALTGVVAGRYKVTVTSADALTSFLWVTIPSVAPAAAYWNIALPLTSSQALSGTKSLDITALTQSLANTYPSLTVPAVRFDRDFTIECWVRPASSTSTLVSFSNTNRANTDMVLRTSSACQVYRGTTVNTVSASSASSNVWTHMALCFEAATGTFYTADAGGVKSLVTGTVEVDAGRPINFFWRPDSAAYNTGHVDSVRVSQSCLYKRPYLVPDPSTWSSGGDTLYYTNFDDFGTEPGAVTRASAYGVADGSVAPLTIAGGTPPYSYAWTARYPGTDVSSRTTAGLSNVVAATYTVTVTDSASSVAKRTYVVGSTAAPVSYWNMALPLSSAQKHTGTNSLDITALTKTFDAYPALYVPALRYDEDFTIECWVRAGSWSNLQAVFGISNSSILSAASITRMASTAVVGSSTATTVVSYTTPTLEIPTVSQWRHVALCRTSTTLYAAYNGVVTTPISAPALTGWSANLPITFLCRPDNSANHTFATGHVDNIRVSQTCLYTANYTVPDPSSWAVGGTTLAVETFDAPTVPVTLTGGAITNNTVFGGSSGSIGAVTASGGSGSFVSHVWTSSAGATTGLAPGLAAHTGLKAGTYTLVTTDSAAGTGTKVFTITEPVAVTLTGGAITNNTVFGGSSGSIGAVTASGGSGTFSSYAWTSTGGGSSVAGVTDGGPLTNLRSGRYTLVVTDSAGGTATAIYDVYQPITLSGGAVTHVNVFGQATGSIAAVVASGGSGVYTHAWTNSGAGSTSVPLPTSLSAKTGLAAGTYSLLISDGAGFSTSAAYVITQNPQLVLTAGVKTDPKGLPDGAITASTLAGGTGIYTIAWTNSGAGSVAVPNPTSLGAKTGLTPGIYVLSVSDSAAAAATTTYTLVETYVTMSVTAPGAVTHASAYNSVNGAIGPPAIAGGLLPAVYSWTSSPGASDVSAANASSLSNMKAGTYVLRILDATSRSLYVTYEVGQPLLLTEEHVDQTRTAPGSIAITARGGLGGNYQYSWTLNGSAFAPTSANLGDLQPGVYVCTVTTSLFFDTVEAIVATYMTMSSAPDLLRAAWTPVAGASAYRVEYRAVDVAGDYTLYVRSTAALYAVIRGLAALTQYRVRVYARMGAKWVRRFSDTVTTAAESALLDKALLLVGDAYDIAAVQSVAAATKEARVEQALATGDNMAFLTAYNGSIVKRTGTLVRRTGTFRLDKSSAVYLPFDSSDKTSVQQADLILANDDVVTVTYSGATDTMQVGGQERAVDSAFLVNGQKALVMTEP